MNAVLKERARDNERVIEAWFDQESGRHWVSVDGRKGPETPFAGIAPETETSTTGWMATTPYWEGSLPRLFKVSVFEHRKLLELSEQSQ